MGPGGGTLPTVVKPRALRHGATIGIAAPAGPVSPERLEDGEAMLRELGFEPYRRADLTSCSGYLAGDDARRAGELMELVDDPGVDAIVCARGGYGCHRIVSRLDPDRVRAARKPLVGYSDVTTLLLWQERCCALAGIHGPMLERGSGVPPSAREHLLALLTGETPAPMTGKSVAPGRAEGRITGGSLTLVAASLGTPWEIDTRGAILLLEEVREAPFRVDRMLQQLRAAGKLDAAVGLGFGWMVECSDERYPSPTVDEVLAEMLTPLGIPVLTELPFGHVADHRAWTLGVRAAIDGDRGELAFLEPGVA